MKLREMDGNFNQANSTISYVERPSFSEISNSRLYNVGNEKRKSVMTPYGQKGKNY